MANYKAETLSRILNEAKTAKEIDGMKNTYAPEDYAKIRQAELVTGQLGGGDYLTPDIDLGTVEFDERGNLKKIGRTRPAMLDLSIYTANRYLTKKYTSEQKYKAKVPKQDKTEMRTRTINHFDIYVVMGLPIVQAITETRELPPTVRAFKFSRTKGSHYAYKGAEFIKSEECYKMTRHFSPETMLYLIRLINEGNAESSGDDGDSLADLDTIANTTETPDLEETVVSEEPTDEGASS